MAVKPIEWPVLPLQLEAATTNGRTTLRCSGKLIAATADSFKTEAVRRIARANILSIDLAGLLSWMGRA